MAWARPWPGWVVLVGLWAWATLAGAAARIAIVLDDLGAQQGPGRAALALPGSVTYAVLPHARFAQGLADQVLAAGRELILHLPMESEERAPLGPGGLRGSMTRGQFEQTLRAALDTLPLASGVNNHMGSRLTGDPRAMGWLMTVLRERGLYFLDSRTTRETLAEAAATAQGVPSARRHVFLDNQPHPGPVRAQYRRLLELARQQGAAIGIGHPHAATLMVLAAELPRLPEQGICLVPLSELMSNPPKE